MRPQREIWGETLASLAENDTTMVVLDGDLANSTKVDLFAARFPERFIEVGIAEQNMVGIAFGLSTLGYRPWLSTFGVFLTNRALDQIRMLVSQTQASVRLGGSYSGLLNGSSGKTHQDIEDLAIMRAMPHMVVLAPADEFEIAAMTAWASQHEGPVYMRVARDAVSPVFDNEYVFTLGAVHTLRRELRKEFDVVLVSTGVQASRVVDAAGLLASQGIDARVVHVPTIKPLDGALLIAALADAPVIITVEEHSIIGGLGSAVSEVLTDRGDGRRVVRLGLADAWSESAPNDFLLDKYGLSPVRVAAQVSAAIGTT